MLSLKVEHFFFFFYKYCAACAMETRSQERRGVEMESRETRRQERRDVKRDDLMNCEFASRAKSMNK